MAVPIQLRGGTLALWTQHNPVIAEREMVLETDTDKFKIGNGVDNYLDLPYGGIVGPQGIQGVQGIQGIQGEAGAPGRFYPSETAPTTNLSNGDAWFNTTNARLFVYYDSYWIEPTPNLVGVAEATLSPFLLGGM